MLAARMRKAGTRFDTVGRDSVAVYIVGERSRYGADHGIRWPAIGAAAAIPAALIAAVILMKAGADHIQPKPLPLLSFDVSEPAPPPAAAVAKPEKTETDIPKPAEIVAPVPEVKLPAPAQQIATTPEPVKPVITQSQSAAAAESAPSPAPAAGPVSVGNLASKMISATPPRYPMESRRKREEGVVVLRLVLSRDGKVASIAIHRSSGVAALDNAAMEAARKWRWSPTIRNGGPVEVTGLVQVPFSLKDS